MLRTNATFVRFGVTDVAFVVVRGGEVRHDLRVDGRIRRELFAPYCSVIERIRFRLPG